MFRLFLRLMLCMAIVCLCSGQNDATSSCFSSSTTCEDFKRCCEFVCRAGFTAICRHVDSASASENTQPAQHDVAFMAGGAPEETPKSDNEGRAGGGIPGLKITDTHCICSTQTSPINPMTMTCLMELSEPNACPNFEKCCQDACSKNVAHAYLCGQKPDGSATSETECLCFNVIPNVPGFEDLDRSKNGGIVDGDKKAQFEDHDGECFNSSSNCESYEKCCVESCKSVDYNGDLLPLKMCVGNKNEKPMKSTHTFCRCPKTAVQVDMAGWGDGTSAGDVSQIFKGASEGDEEDAGAMVHVSKLVYFLCILYFLVNMLY